jgi:NADPH-dependent glutamate synthase beta subunit-like oxidoreductase
VAADFRGEIKNLLPKAPTKTNGKKVALIGAGPASLTVANDLAPLGYEITLFEKQKKGGGAMRSSVPLFRLPESVLDDEIEAITDMGIDVRYGSEVKSLRRVIDQYDAVFVGSGAPLGRDLPLPGRQEAGDRVHIGLYWLAQVAFEHAEKVAKEVLVIGGGNTAMDCCRTALRWGARNVKVVAPEGFDEMLASTWEKEDAIDEGVEILNNLLPVKYEVKDGKLAGVWFQPLVRCYDENKKWNPIHADKPLHFVPCDEVLLAIGQNTAFPFIERDMGIEFDKNDRPIVDARTMRSTHTKVFFGGDSAFGPKNIIWAVAHGHEAALSIHMALTGADISQRPPRGMSLTSQKMGLHEWSYDNDVSNDGRLAVPHVKLEERFEALSKEVELGYDVKLAFKEAERCLNCDVQTVFQEKLCIECDACVDICPVECLTITDDGTPEQVKSRLSAPFLNETQIFYMSEELPGTKRIMAKDENICLHCGLCAERCPTGAWDMQKFQLHLPQAGK